MKQTTRIYRICVAVLLLAHIAGLPKAFAQQTRPTDPVFFETASQGMTRFYFDDRYFLADRDCEFRAVERIGTFDHSNHVFVGAFRDYNNYGQLILEGAYQDGLKHGDFKAYHGNGHLKWEVNFDQGEVNGEWKYYYPDGRPMLTTKATEEGTLIQDYWDQKGKQRVEMGQGSYEVKIEIDGYSPYGAQYIVRKGRIKDGKQQGIWNLYMVYDGGQTEHVGGQVYRNGTLVADPESSLSLIPSGASLVYLSPIPWFARAEEMIAKGCSIDEYTGFTEYLTLYLEGLFAGYYLQEFQPVRVEFELKVSKDGKLLGIQEQGEWLALDFLRRVKSALQTVDFWFPTYQDGAYVDDTLSLSFDIFPDQVGQTFRFFDAKIQRNNK